MKHKSKAESAYGVIFRKLNTKRWESRDAYHWMLTLSWPHFALFVFGIYLGINVLFAFCYHLQPHCIAEMNPDSWGGAFFFSVETLATVGYGHMYPASAYGHVIATLEIVVGMFGMAIITGIIFIRFSRPVARIIFSENLVIGPFDGQPALMLRMANLRDHAMAEAEFRLTLLRDEMTKEGEIMRRIYPLQLQFDRLIYFPAVITIRHIIDEHSPLHGWTLANLEKADTRFSTSIVCIDTVISSSVQSNRTYTWKDVRLDHRFVEVYSSIEDNVLTVDYSLIHATEPIKPANAPDGTAP